MESRDPESSSSVAIISTVRSLYVYLPSILEDVGLCVHARLLRHLPLSVEPGALMDAARVAESAADAARRLVGEKRAEAKKAQLIHGTPGSWETMAQLIAAESAATAAECAAAAGRLAATSVLGGSSFFSGAAEQAAAESELAAVDALLSAAAGVAGTDSFSWRQGCAWSRQRALPEQASTTG